MRYQFDNIVEFFNLLNAAEINYLVLRNYENLLSPEMYLDGHGDIDLLCEDAQGIVKLVGAVPLTPDVPPLIGDGIHYSIEVRGCPVQLDLRQVGDGYYCTRWQRDLLDRRVEHESFFVMTDEDYFYTLAYHAVLQKSTLSHEYKCRLAQMASELGIDVGGADERCILRTVERYMRERDYRFTYTSDILVPNRFNLVDSALVEDDSLLRRRHRRYDCKIAIINWLVRCKHILLFEHF